MLRSPALMEEPPSQHQGGGAAFEPASRSWVARGARARPGGGASRERDGGRDLRELTVTEGGLRATEPEP